MLNLILGGAGTGKSRLLMEKIKTASEQNRKITVIVPDQFSFEFDRALYKYLGLEKFNLVTVLSFSRLAKYIFITYGGIKGQYADDIVKTAIMHTALKTVSDRGDLAFYKKQAKSQDFLNLCLAFVKDMTLNAITPEFLSSKSTVADENLHDKLSDMSAIYSEYTREMSEKGYKDSLTDISVASERASATDCFKGQDIFIDEFKSFTADETMLIETMISQADNFTICLCTENKVPSKHSVFETVDKTHRKLEKLCETHNVKINITLLNEQHRFKSPAIAHISSNVLRSVREICDVDTDDVRITEVADIYKEADVVASQISHLVMDNKYRYNDIAVVARNLESYSSVLQSAFEKYNIPFYEDRKEPVVHKSLIIFVSAVIEIISSDKYNTEDILRYLKTGFAGISAEEISTLEDYCYEWNVDSKMWGEEFSADDGICEDIRKRITEPLDELKKLCKNKTGNVICTQLFAFFDKINLQGRIKSMIEDYKGTDTAVLSSVRELKLLWDMLCKAFESLYKALFDVPVSLKQFYDLFYTVMTNLQISMPPQTLDCVTVASASTSRLADPSVVFVMGVNEGVFPDAPKSTGIFSERDRKYLGDCGIELSGSVADKISEEKFIAYNTLSAPSEKLFLSYPLADSSGKGMYPSFVAGHIKDMFRCKIVFSDKEIPLIYMCTTPQSAYYNFVEEYNRNDEQSASLRYALKELPSFSQKINYLDNMNISCMHKLDSKTGQQLFGKKMYVSATGFENYNVCPFKYFCQKGLNIYPKRRVELGSPEIGSVIHYCLCEILSKNKKDKFIALKRDEVKEFVVDCLKKYYDEYLGGDYGKTERYNTLYFKMSAIIEDIVIHLQQEFSQSSFVPTEFEYKISDDAKHPVKSIRAENGTEIFFIGTIDRIDTAEIDGEKFLRVVDYKSGTKIFSFDDLVYGVNMQMLLYMFSVIYNNGDFKDYNPAGVLYMPASGTEATLSRNPDPTDIDSLKNKNYKMNGVVLFNDDVFEAMEEGVTGIYIPVKRTKDFYTKASSYIGENELQNLRKYSEQLLKNMAVSLDNGDVKAVPLVKKGRSPCSYCDYNSVCGNYPNYQVRPYADNINVLVDEMLNAKEGE